MYDERRVKFWQQIKKNTPKIQWTRLESWSSMVFQICWDTTICGFFMVELKIQNGKKIVLTSSKNVPYDSYKP